MTRSNHMDHCPWTLERIEPYLDGEIDAQELATFESHLSTCASCAQELELASRIVGELRALPSLHSPDHIVDAALERAQRKPITGRVREWIDRGLRGAMRPAMAAMLVVVIAVTVFVVTQRDRTSPQMLSSEYSDAEIQDAQAQAIIAFAYVGKYTSRASTILTDDVLGERVFPPVRAAVDESRGSIIDEVFLDPISRAMIIGIFPETKLEDKRSE